MQVSARILGREYGLTAEEMNRVLVKLGFLKGEPGNYDLTEKALQYAIEKSYHRGTGGYSCYNRYWTERTFDDSIKEVLNVTSELIKEVRNELSAARAARKAAQAIATEEFLAKRAAEKAALEVAEQAALKRKALWKRVGKISLVVGGSAVIVYGVCKFVIPKVRKWHSERKQTSEDKENDVTQ